VGNTCCSRHSAEKRMALKRSPLHGNAGYEGNRTPFVLVKMTYFFVFFFCWGVMGAEEIIKKCNGEWGRQSFLNWILKNALLVSAKYKIQI